MLIGVVVWVIHLFVLSIYLAYAGAKYNPKLFSGRDLFWLLNGAILIYLPMSYMLQQYENLIL